MRKTVLILALILLVCSNSSPLSFQFGSNLARYVQNHGVIFINCYGGSGEYTYSYSNLPQGWSQSGNSIIVPNLSTVRGTYTVFLEVSDTIGNVLSGNIVLNINGLAITITPASGSNNNVSSPFSGGGVVIPGSGTGSAGIPSSGTVSGTRSPNIDISGLYSGFPGLPSGTNVLPNPGSNFPTFPSPSGNPSSPNVVPGIIRTIQAPKNPARDQTPPTVEEVKRNAVFNRQLNANKAVANLVSIIQQLTANINAARNDIPLLEQALRDAQISYSQCTDEIFPITDTRTRIQNAISSRQQRINDANDKITAATNGLEQLLSTLNELKTKRSEAQNNASPNAAKLQELQRNLDNCNQKLTQQRNQFDAINSQISNLQAEIGDLQNQLDSAPLEIQRIDLQIPIVDNRIADLQRQLQNARKQKSDLLVQKSQFQSIIRTAESEIRRLQNQIPSLRNRLQIVESRVLEYERQCAIILSQLREFRNQLAQNEASFQTLLQQITRQQTRVEQRQSQIDRIRNSIQDLPNEINLLNAELRRVNSNLNRQYYICNDLADQVRKAKQNLEALNSRLQRQTSYLEQANINLEKARSEKELADIAVQQIISASTSALPFSIVPNGQGTTDAGNPRGNNPSGSALGPVPIRNEVDPTNSIIIGDISSYLSRAYGASVDPARPQTVSSIYPLSIVTLEALINKDTTGFVNPSSIYSPPPGNIYQFTCSGSSPIKGSGRIYSVQPGRIQLRNESGLLVNLQISGCSKLQSTKPNHILAINDMVYYKGAAVNTSGNISLHSMTCI